MAQDTCIPRKQQNSSTWLLAHSKAYPTVNVISDTSLSTNIACRQDTGRMVKQTQISDCFCTSALFTEVKLPSAPFTSGLSQHLIITLKHIPKWMEIHHVVNILKKKSSWKVCEWVAMQNRMLAFPLIASFPSSSYFFANFSSISHMRSRKVNIFPRKLVLA